MTQERICQIVLHTNIKHDNVLVLLDLGELIPRLVERTASCVFILLEPKVVDETIQDMTILLIVEGSNHVHRKVSHLEVCLLIHWMHQLVGDIDVHLSVWGVLVARNITIIGDILLSPILMEITCRGDCAIADVLRIRSIEVGYMVDQETRDH